MSMEESQRLFLVEREIEKAKATLTEVADLIRLEHWSGAASRLYYAVFHSICALLIKDNRTVKSHKGAGIAFRQHYIYTHVFPQQYGQLFGQLEALREESDYNCFYDVTSEEVMSRFEPAKEMISAIEKRVTLSSELTK